MDFEQALKAGGTVVLEEGRRLETLGVSTPGGRSGTSRPAVSTKLFQPATPTVVPPTPTSEGRQRHSDRTRRPKADRSTSGPSSASSSSVPIETALPPSPSPTSTPVIPPPMTFDDQDDMEVLSKRRSLLRSPGTASSPDLATLVRKAKERGGVVGDSQLPNGNSHMRLDTGNSSQSHQQDPSPSSSQRLSPLLPAATPTSSSAQERARTRTQSTASSAYSLVSSPGEDTPGPSIRPRSRVTKAEKVLGVAGRPMGNTPSFDDPWNQNAEKKSTIRSKTTALWSKMTGSTRSQRPGSSGTRTTPVTPISPTSASSPFSFASSNGNPGISVHPPPLPSGPSAWRRPSDPQNATKPLPPIYNMVAPSEEDMRSVLGMGPAPPSVKPPRPPRKAKSSRRRSMSVDAVDLRQALAMGGRISEERDRERSSRDKPQPQTPTSFSFEKGKQKEDKDEGLLKGWKLSADLGDMSDLRGAVAGLGSLILDDGGGTVKGRPRAHSEMVPMEQQLKPPLPHSKSTPTTPILSSDISDADAAGRSSMSDATAMPSDRNTPDPSDASDYDTAPQSASSSKFTSSVPQWSPTSRDTLHVQPPQRRAGPGGSLNADGSSPVRSYSAGSTSEPSLLPEHIPSTARRGSDDATARQRLQVSIDSPTPHRSLRMMTSPGRLRMGMDPSASSLEVSVYDYTGDGTTSPIAKSPSDGQEDLQTKAKTLAERCWQEDETFLAREKIAEWIGGHGNVNKLTLPQYMNHFNFTGLRLDNAFRHLCQKLFLKAETQQVDRILEDFGRRYFECNPNGLFGSPSVVHSVSYSLLLLNTDLHVAELASHMSRTQFVRNTLFAITEANRPTSPSVSPNGGARASTPDLPSQNHRGDDASSRKSGETSDGPSTLRMRSKRSGSIHSWKSISKEALGGVLGNASTPALTTSTSQAPTSPSINEPKNTFSRNSVHMGSVNYGRSWEHEMETLLKEMYNAVKAQQILQPTAGPSMERPSMSSLTPGSSLIARSRSQKSYNNALKRGSIRGIQTLLGSQSPYSSNNSSSTDGRVSPSPSFATSLGDSSQPISASSSSLFAPTLGFASNLSHTIIKEAQEDDAHSVASVDTDDTTVSMTDEELALQGPPWAKEGMLCRKQYWETATRRAKDKSWNDVFVVIQKGELSMFVFGGAGGGAGANANQGAAVGGGNWLSNAQHLGTFSLAHSLSHSLPPPGYNRSRPHCFVLTLSTDAVYFFQAASEDLINEWVSTCNYWAARVSKEPLSGGVSNMEYGWSRVDAGTTNSSSSHTGHSLERWETDHSDAFSMRSGRSKLSKKSLTDVLGTARSQRSQYSPFAMEKIYINDWKPPMASTMHSKSDEESQLEALQKQVSILKADLTNHDNLQIPMKQMYQPRSPNYNKATANWEAKSKYLMHEIFKYETYVECLRNAMTLRMKKRGERVLEKALVASVDEDSFSPTVRTRRSGKGLREETIQETEEPVTPGPNGSFIHKRDGAIVDSSDD